MDKDILRQFADNPLLMETVKRKIMVKFSVDDPRHLYGLTNERMGEVIRAKLDGRAMVEEAFTELKNYQTIKQKELVANPAR